MRYARALGAMAVVAAGAACAPGVPRSPLPARVTDAAPRLPARPVEVRLDPYFRDLTTVRLTSGTDTLSLLLDTGGGHTLLTVEAARRLGCTPFGSTAGHRMSGERVEFQWCTGIRLELEGVLLGDGRIAVFDLMKLLPPELPKVDGVLSLDVFDDAVVTIDLAGSRLVLESDSSASARRSFVQQLTARRATGEDGSSLTIFVAVQGTPAPAWLLLDSGNLVGTIVSPESGRRMGLTMPSPEANGASNVVSATVDVLGAGPTRGPVVIRDLIHDGALGADFMRRGTFTFDLRPKNPWVGFAPKDR